MNSPRCRRLALAALLCSALGNAHAASFVYEGRLDDLGQAANSRYDLRLSAYGHAAQGTTLAAPITFEGVEVREGRFRLDVELPAVQADQVWLEVAVRGSGEPSFSAIPGRAKAIAAPLIGTCWSSTGDSGTNPATNFIGTTDAQPFLVRTANARSLRIEPSAQTFGSPALPITSNTIGGSRSNVVSAGVRGATIAGGGLPSGDSDPDFLNESPNRVTDHYGTVSGGYANRAGDNGALATVGGGSSNTASGTGSAIGGGSTNIAGGDRSTIGGGSTNTADGFVSTVGGGSFNTAIGFFSTVGGGTSNCAGGDYSWAGGRRARVRPGIDPGGSGSCSDLTYPGGTGDEGTFVWADSQSPNFVSTGDDQFLVRAAGGMGINNNNPFGNALRVNGTLRLDELGTAAATTLCRNINNQISGCSSSARYKQDIDDLALGLDTALRLHAVGYRWKDSLEADIGFVAEEIAVIDERLITRNAKGEIEGVKYDRLTAVLANAVQELAAQGSLAAETMARVSSENAALRADSDALRARLERLEASLGERVAGER
jgi:hypothetical protein